MRKRYSKKNKKNYNRKKKRSSVTEDNENQQLARPAMGNIFLVNDVDMHIEKGIK